MPVFNRCRAKMRVALVVAPYQSGAGPPLSFSCCRSATFSFLDIFVCALTCGKSLSLSRESPTILGEWEGGIADSSQYSLTSCRDPKSINFNGNSPYQVNNNIGVHFVGRVHNSNLCLSFLDFSRIYRSDS